MLKKSISITLAVLMLFSVMITGVSAAKVDEAVAYAYFGECQEQVERSQNGGGADVNPPGILLHLDDVMTKEGVECGYNCYAEINGEVRTE